MVSDDQMRSESPDPSQTPATLRVPFPQPTRRRVKCRSLCEVRRDETISNTIWTSFGITINGPMAGTATTIIVGTNHEDRAYRMYLGERRQPYVEFGRVRAGRRRAYFRWRHEQPDNTLFKIVVR